MLTHVLGLLELCNFLRHCLHISDKATKEVEKHRILPHGLRLSQQKGPTSATPRAAMAEDIDKAAASVDNRCGDVLVGAPREMGTNLLNKSDISKHTPKRVDTNRC